MERTKLTDEAREAERPAFESRAFNKRFVMSVRKVGDGPFAMQSVGCPTLAEFIKRRADGHYEDETLNAMWWAWCASIEEGRPS